MTRLIQPNEMVRLRKKSPQWPENRFKVTARYEVQLGSGCTIACVRVHAFINGGGMSLHFSAEEFKRMFLPMEKQ